MTRKEFLSQVGIGAATLILPACIAGCKKSTSTTTIDFTIDVSSGALSKNGGYLVNSGVIVARTSAGNFVAVAAACTHEGTNVQFSLSGNNFTCPNHGAQFDTTGTVTKGPASTSLKQYNTSLSGSSLRVYS